MNRRGFLKILSTAALGAAASAIVPSEIWTPGKVTHFLPPAGGWKPNALAFHPDAFTLACKDLPVPEYAVDRKLGLSMRLVRQYDIQTDQKLMRMDVLIGFAQFPADSALSPELMALQERANDYEAAYLDAQRASIFHLADRLQAEAHRYRVEFERALVHDRLARQWQRHAMAFVRGA